MTDQAERALDDARDVESSVHDPDRFTAVFDRYFAEIHGYAARRLGPDAADDIAADTFTTAFGERRRFDAERGMVRAWLYGIATNHIARYRRRELRGYRAMARLGPAPAGESHADRVIERVAASEVGRQLAGALAALNRGDREVLLLTALAGLSHAEIAVALGIPYGTVGSRLNRVRRKLRAELAQMDPDGEDGRDG
jgi:RNA polymerase sigma factor (sigma-70 family)